MSSSSSRPPDIILITDEVFASHPCLSYNIKCLTMEHTIIPPQCNFDLVTNVKISYCQQFAVTVHPRRCWSAFIVTSGPLPAGIMNEMCKIRVVNIHNHDLVINAATHLCSLLLMPYPALL